MRRIAVLFTLVVLPAAWWAGWTATTLRAQGAAAAARATQAARPDGSAPALVASVDEEAVRNHAAERIAADRAAVETFRPAYPFWQYIFTIPDGHIAFGSAKDGRLLVTFPTNGDWQQQATWSDPALSAALAGAALPRRPDDRREEAVRRLTPLAGPLVHNPTRGLFLEPNAKRYGRFLSEWSGIYERFAVPGDIGLSQAILESGLDGTARSRAGALGFCQWLRPNWNRLNRAVPYEIEAYNQTTQAPFCAAHLSVLATMYGSYIPALSEHHSGGVNVGRVVINGERLGGHDPREQYFLGASFARDLRSVSIQRYRDLFRTYGPRSFLYAEMVFGNTLTVQRIIQDTPQAQVYAMRTSRAIPLAEVARRSGLSTDEVKRYNPALVKQVPAKAHIYLPRHVPELGSDVSFWHRPPSRAFASVLNEFVRLDATVQRWHEPGFEPTLRSFQRRFEDTATEEGTVMAATLGYIIEDIRTSRRAAILEDFRTSGRILDLFSRGTRELGLILTGSL
jgi:hypothetical protein